MSNPFLNLLLLPASTKCYGSKLQKFTTHCIKKHFLLSILNFSYQLRWGLWTLEVIETVTLAASQDNNKNTYVVPIPDTRAPESCRTACKFPGTKKWSKFWTDLVLKTLVTLCWFGPHNSTQYKGKNKKAHYIYTYKHTRWSIFLACLQVCVKAVLGLIDCRVLLTVLSLYHSKRDIVLRALLLTS